MSEKLLQTHVTPPLDGCTYLGLDSGAPPLQVRVFVIQGSWSGRELRLGDVMMKDESFKWKKKINTRKLLKLCNGKKKCFLD